MYLYIMKYDVHPDKQDAFNPNYAGLESKRPWDDHPARESERSWLLALGTSFTFSLE
jgi:hypothetical protein